MGRPLTLLIPIALPQKLSFASGKTAELTLECACTRPVADLSKGLLWDTLVEHRQRRKQFRPYRRDPGIAGLLPVLLRLRPQRV